ncbi:MAG: methyltransferase [Defluviitaleaceae bacterium]|nr:methyltransferase [Defluviitaleaceae bacterium]
MRGLSFIWQYITKPRTVGAVAPSSKYLAKKMIQDIDFENTQYIVEYGPGTGVFTEKILKSKKPSTILLIIENNEEFYQLLEKRYPDEANLYIIKGSAADLEKYMKQYDIPYADYIVSGLPFASLPQDVSIEILEQTKKHLKPGGRFITFQYTLLKKDFIGRFFNEIDIRREMRNIPPAYVLSCKLLR